MRITQAFIFALAACQPTLQQDASYLVSPDVDPPLATCPICTEDPTLALEFFGDGRDGDFTVPPGGTYVLTRDMYWHDLIFVPGTTTRIDPSGFAIRVSGTLRGPGLIASGGVMVPAALIGRDGSDAVLDAVGFGYVPSGTIGQGGSGQGGAGDDPGGDHGHFPTNSGLGVWPSDFHPGNGGSGGSAEFLTGVPGIGAAIVSPSSGSTDLMSAIRMRTIDGVPISGGAPGAGGVGFGGAGGAGGGNIVVLARQVERADSILVTSRGGRGGGAVASNGGGGGGGSGGYVTLVVYRRPFPLTSVVGGAGGTHLGDAHDGTSGGAGIVLPFSFVF